MATEAKVEAKTESKPEAAKKEVVIVEENTEPPLKYKTWPLKVSIHCEGCKRKVKKILHGIEGVYKTDVDLRQQKVTVIGNIDAETLINKLRKAGKRAELLPVKAEQKEKNKSKAKNKPSDQESSEEGCEKEKEIVKVEVRVQCPPKVTENVGTNENDHDGANVIKISESGAISKDSGQIKEVKTEIKQTVTLPAGNQSPVADKKVCGGGENEGGADKSGSGSGGKKKKKKGHKGTNNNTGEGEHSGDVPAGTGSPTHGHGQVPGQSLGQGPVPYLANQSPPRYPVFQHPSHYYPPPMHVVNYNTAYPSTSYSGSHYVPPYSYAYMHEGSVSEPPPSDFESYSSQQSDSFEIFSDENPNACSIV